MKIFNSIVNIFRWAGRSLLAQKSNPRINQKRDLYGNLYWQIDDFTTNRSYTFDSDRDVINWIEERYNRF